MLKNHMKNHIKKQLESMGENTGERIGRVISKSADQKAAQIGKKLGKKVAEQAERVHARLEKESVDKKEQLGVGGKIGTGLGIIGKNLIEKRYGFLGRLAGSADFVSEGRTLGAKAEKIVKRTVKEKLDRLMVKKQSPGGKNSDKA